ncbi:hypothetical protein QTG54_014070 [Skeletonema marinoi]|uniref:Uncharacterized protein n=1 Tax=Skeletonema marinoi TaxID=267567 RepID=A0AAD8XWZ5_9STRA|nr:hypothetical protein QTG54_014070 [Skeletonema marinoi]
MMACCSKVICDGCFHANYMREFEERLENRCHSAEKITKTYEECDKQKMKEWRRMIQCYKGNIAVHLVLMKAAELGDAAAHYRLSCMYHNGMASRRWGKGNEVEKDCEKEFTI